MSKGKVPSRTSYRHGNLREALIEAAVQLVEEGGPENVSVREAAKRAGVSPGAPFRHFTNKTALMTAVAEQAMRLFKDEVIKAVEAVPQNDPMARFAAIGSAYLHWAIHNPTHFQIISTRNLIDWGGSESLREDNKIVRSLMEEAIVDTQQQGKLRSDNIAETHIAARAIVYGLGRMYIDGHFTQWAVSGEDAERTVQNVLKFFISLLGNEGAAPPKKTSVAPELRTK
ncbi:TetR/AcrR family transcriptional regulator [Mesorhizobium sp. YR577]|uniref:TetR/AcrR family transcriptional regulator n=1 Tax=Mesorhizobium sp. YR577 TaxID=1884373 RepID=UPI0008EC2DDA|nr:TetR/AcrR family transcriptional regulator [Mesorhizobium sp. YR577]SFU23402.1 transcriptional regulator, TetR family [Mesorhizobium sp. YR577]